MFVAILIAIFIVFDVTPLRKQVVTSQKSFPLLANFIFLYLVCHSNQIFQTENVIKYDLIYDFSLYLPFLKYKESNRYLMVIISL